jgi:hypothetical protein
MIGIKRMSKSEQEPDAQQCEEFCLWHDCSRKLRLR